MENVLNSTEGIYRNHLFHENVLDGTKCVAKRHFVQLKTFIWYQMTMERRKPIVGGVMF